MVKIHVLPILRDNFSYILIAPEHRTAAVIDAGSAAPVIDFLKTENLTLTHILCTHHHHDHTDGLPDLIAAYPRAKIYAPAKEQMQIAHVTHPVMEPEIIIFHDISLHVIETGGHTRGGISFYCPQNMALFSGDCLFSLGCGRLFEGTAQDLWQAFEKIRALDPQTCLYPGHEYTLANGRFCLEYDPQNIALRQRIKQAQDAIDKGLPTIPVTLAQELQTNIFLRAADVDQLAYLRTLKDSYP
jgi:hydroxyacylglutathione hydrolase